MGNRFSIPTRTCLLAIIIPMFAVALILRIVFAFIPTPRPDMLLEADGLIETATVADAQAHTAMPIAMPDDLLGGAVYTVGVYTKGAGALPVGSAVVIATKNDWRFVEIVERPSTALPDVTNDYNASVTEPVALGEAEGTLLTLSTNNIPCVSPNEKWGLPGFCEVRNILLFEKDGVVYSVAADGAHATEGELITLAKDLLE